MNLIEHSHFPATDEFSLSDNLFVSFSVAVNKLRMVMQFQELENLIQISPCHSRTPSGFVMEMMSVKPAKGTILFWLYRGRSRSLKKFDVFPKFIHLASCR